MYNSKKAELVVTAVSKPNDRAVKKEEFFLNRTMVRVAGMLMNCIIYNIKGQTRNFEMTSDKIVGKEVSIMGSGENSDNLVSRKRDVPEGGEGKPAKRTKAEDDDEVWLISKQKTSYEGEYEKERVVRVLETRAKFEKMRKMTANL